MEPAPQPYRLPASQLIWRIFWRATVWGVGGGSCLGFLYLPLTGVIELLYTLVQPGKSSFASDTPSLGALIAYAIGSGLLGWIIGGLVGLFVGVLNGLVLGVITHLFFYPRTKVVRYRWVVGLVSTCVSVLGAWIGFTWTIVRPLSGGFFSPDMTDFIILPTIITGVTAIVASQRVATWFIREVSEEWE